MITIGENEELKRSEESSKRKKIGGLNRERVGVPCIERCCRLNVHFEAVLQPRERPAVGKLQNMERFWFLGSF